jgi:pentatricopeptide repeat domain-containing protein 1
MIVRLLRLAILLEVLLSCCKSYHSPFSFPGDYQSIKEVLRFAKNDPSLINHANIIAKDYIAQNSIQNIKDAMCCVSIFKLADDTASAMKVIENMNTRNLKADTFLYNNVISVCTKTKDWRQAIELLLIMQNKGVSSDTISFSSAISACAKAGRWRESLNLLNEMTIAGIAADTICYSSAISACAAAGCWKEALLLLSDMKAKKIAIDTIVCNSAISACVPSGEWTVALRLMDLMRVEGLVPNAYTYAAAMSACDTAGECDEALRLLERLLVSMTPPPPQHESAVNIEEDINTSTHRTTPAVLDICTATVPFNVAIAATTKCGRISKARGLFNRMGTLGVPKNTITYTTLIVGITKSKNFDQRLLLDVHQMMIDANIKRNGAIFGAVIAAAEKLDDCGLTLSLLEQMKAEGVATTSFVYHSAISACGKSGRLDRAVELLEEMKERKVERTSVTYSLLMNACRRSGEWVKALQFIEDMELDFNSGVCKTNSDNIPKPSDSDCPARSPEGLRPDTIVYSTAISVCVGSQQWGLALELLERMEQLLIPRNVVTYNTVIEALSNAGETARAELVYQSALRTGVYNHWHRSSQHHNTQRDRQRIIDDKVGRPEIMDLHNFPIAVAKTAVMLVLGEMCTGSIPIADPLVIITGRGNHASADGQRGVLRREMLDFCSNLGLELNGFQEVGKQKSSTLRDRINDGDSTRRKSNNRAQGGQYDPLTDSDDFHSQTSYNPGRLWLTKSSTVKWLEEQRNEHEVLRCSGSKGVHGNLFLKVAMAHRKLSLTEEEISLNVRAVCPFSTATHDSDELPVGGVESLQEMRVLATMGESTVAVAAIPAVKKCPAHAVTPVIGPIV